MGIYLDYNASSPIDIRVLDYMVDIYKNHIGNADSRTHTFGDDTRSIVENARQEVADLLGVKKDEIFFTSGSTESNNIAILGLKKYGMQSNKRHIITTSIEHKAVLGAASSLIEEGFEVDFVHPDDTGRISVEDLISKIRPDTLLVSVMHVNNETGIIQPVKEIGAFLEDKGIYFHIDATQSAGKLVDEVRELQYDMLSISAHKMHGPQGIGALVLKKKKYKLPPINPVMYGGQQEHGIRPGTLPVALIGGFGKACKYATDEYRERTRICADIKDKLMILVCNSGLTYHINGDPRYCVPTTLNISFIGVSSEALMLATKQFCGISNGSACNSSSYSHSHVLSAMQLSEERIDSALRISWDSDVNVEMMIDEFKNLLETVHAFQ